ncbi:diguanylate cyclase [Roseomonas sp. AR75]|uniref:GGDEF domain-containing protein n=1 Tax=Roseomonas sp. AR75 TaxID=2562311 RepID=UPI00148571CD|nr:sensor domain-containing diguanylate cyclase [Roseomonas sp. AR75]
MNAVHADPLSAALLESRARWRDMALLAADLLFETDAAGRLTFVAPEEVLGHAAETLLGQSARQLLAPEAVFDPFDPAAPPRGFRAWFRRADGSEACLEITAFTLESGGLRGVARDVTAEERGDAATARMLRRTTALARLLVLAERGRAREGAAGPALAKLLEGICQALGCSGAALLEAGLEGWHILPGSTAPSGPPDATLPVAPDLRLAIWRDPPPDREEAELLLALAPSLAGLHAEAGRQQELARAARTDPLTGLLNRRGFADALAAGRARQPRGVLAYLDMDGLKRVNDRHGHAAGDAAIRAMAARLSEALRPGELAARLGGDEFALWLPGATPAMAQARCGSLGVPGPLVGFPDAGEAAVAASIGLAEVALGETEEVLLARADAAMYSRKRERRAA